MRRRNFINGIIGLAVASPLMARAQQAERVRRLALQLPFPFEVSAASGGLVSSPP